MLILPASCLSQNLSTIRRIPKRKLRIEVLDNYRGETQHGKNKTLAMGHQLVQLSHYEDKEFRNLFAVARDGGHGRLVPPL